MPLLSDNSDFKISHTAKCIASHDSDLTTLYRRPSMCGKCHIHLRIFQYFIFFYHCIRTKTEFETVPVSEWIAEDDLMIPRPPVMDLK